VCLAIGLTCGLIAICYVSYLAKKEIDREVALEEENSRLNLNNQIPSDHILEGNTRRDIEVAQA
jgi:catabolite regulation protein CreA